MAHGARGKGPRTLDLTLRPYLEKAGANLHFWLVDISPEQVEYRAIDINGQIFDVYPPDADGAAKAGDHLGIVEFTDRPRMYAGDRADADDSDADHQSAVISKRWRGE